MSDLLVHDFIDAPQVSGPLEAKEDRIARARAEVVAVAAKLSRDRRAVDGPLGSMMEDVDLDEPEEEIADHADRSLYQPLLPPAGGDHRDSPRQTPFGPVAVKRPATTSRLIDL
jgi:hypothetical protein